MSIEISGLEEWAEALRALKRSGVNRVIRRAVNAASTPILKAMRRHARARDKTDTGALGKSIGRVIRTNRRTGKTRAYVGPLKGYELTGEVKDRRKGRRGKMRKVTRMPRRYAHLLEYGARPHDIAIKTKSGKEIRYKHPGMQPEPFVRPAFDESKDAAVAAFAKVMGEGIDKEMLKLTVRKKVEPGKDL